MKSELRSLLRRIESAQGPEHDLDRTIAERFPILGRASADGAAPPYTNSLDASMDLLGRVLPGWSLQLLSIHGAPAAHAEIWPQGLRPERCHEASGRTPTLALLSAILQARLADAERGCGDDDLQVDRPAVARMPAVSRRS